VGALWRHACGTKKEHKPTYGASPESRSPAPSRAGCEYFPVDIRSQALGRVHQGPGMLSKLKSAYQQGVHRLRAERDAALAERDAYRTQLDIAVYERNEFLRQRDVLLGELNEVRSERDWLACQKEDLAPAEVLKLTIERNMLLEQRDQAYGEVDDLCRERNDLREKLDRLKKGPGRVASPREQNHPAIAPISSCAS